MLTKYPTDELLNAYGSLIYTVGDKKAGINYVEQAILRNPANPNIWLNRIELEKGLGSSQRTIVALYNRALKSTNYHLNIIVSYASYMGQK